MIETFTQTFTGTFLAVLKVFIIAVGAGVLVRKKVITQEQIKSLSAVTVNVLLPCLIFSSMTRSFHPTDLPIWWILPLAGAAMVIFGLILGGIFFARKLYTKKNMLPLASTQSAGYLVLPLGSVLFAQQFDIFATYCFLFILAVTPLNWSLCKYLTTAAENDKLTWKTLITPPFVASIFALFLIFTNLNGFIPKVFS